MRLGLRVSARALQEIEGAHEWYNRQRRGLGEDFLAALDGRLNTIRQTPEIFPVAHRGIRRAFLQRFPYAVFFVVTERDVVVIGVIHAARDPNRWPG